MSENEVFTTVKAAATYLGWSRMYLYTVLDQLMEAGALDEFDLPKPTGYPRSRQLPRSLIYWLKANHKKSKGGRPRKLAVDNQAND